MQLFEVGEHIRPGFKLTTEEGRRPSVPLLAFDNEAKGPTCVSLGNSLCKLLRHPEDRGTQWTLLWGKLRDTNVGLTLVAQTEEAAKKDRQALVLLDRCYLPNVPLTEVVSTYEYADPERLTYSVGEGHQRDLFLFKPGEGLLIRWDRRLLGTNKDLKFILVWKADAQGQMTLQKEMLPASRPRLLPSPRQPEAELQLLVAQ